MGSRFTELRCVDLECMKAVDGLAVSLPSSVRNGGSMVVMEYDDGYDKY